jgi:hypothetical protein
VTKTFEQVAQVLAKKLSSLLQTAVFVSDSKQNVIASRDWQSHPSFDRNETDSLEQSDRYLRLPLHIEDQVGEVKIIQATEGKPCPLNMPRLLLI